MADFLIPTKRTGASLDGSFLFPPRINSDKHGFYIIFVKQKKLITIWVNGSYDCMKSLNVK